MKVINVFFEDRYGGPHKRAIQVAKEIKANGVSTVIVLPAGQGNAAEVAAQEGVPAVRISFCRMPRLSRVFHVIRWLFFLPVDITRFVNYFKKEKPDVVHVNGAFFIAPAVAAKIAWIPIVWHLNDTIVSKHLAFCLGMLVKLLSNQIIVAARAVALHYCIPEGRCVIVYAPVDTRKIRSHYRRDTGSGAASIGFIANWSPIKGVEYYVQAAAMLLDRIKCPLQIMFAGQRMSNVEYCQGIERMIDSTGIRPMVVDFGFVSDIDDFLAKVDILVMSSTTEACPMSVLEAMAAGVPVVASDVGGTRELLLEGDNKAGIVVPVKDASAIAEALLEILQSPDESRQMGTNGRLLVERKFSLDVCAGRHYQVYRNACGYQ